MPHANLTSFQALKEPTGREIKYGLMDNSETLAVGEVIIPAIQGDIGVVKTGGGTTGALLGVVRSIVGKDGKVLELNSKTVENDNVTDKMIQVTFVPIFLINEYAGALDADAETTDNSQSYGTFAVTSTGLLLTESSYTAFTTVIAKQFFSYGVTPASVRNVTGVFTKMIGHTA